MRTNRRGFFKKLVLFASGVTAAGGVLRLSRDAIADPPQNMVITLQVQDLLRAEAVQRIVEQINREDGLRCMYWPATLRGLR